MLILFCCLLSNMQTINVFDVFPLCFCYIMYDCFHVFVLLIIWCFVIFWFVIYSVTNAQWHSISRNAHLCKRSHSHYRIWYLIINWWWPDCRGHTEICHATSASSVCVAFRPLLTLKPPNSTHPWKWTNKRNQSIRK